ncbi:hypothetical protein SODALDRAFT_328738 [Sodiomyces alkalinus F11]|uniref:MFS maltose permease n=1 Tax=Sodiomyces alkalinus (strain CBS 110278 / VKM F-3762 / F11) TaxID=1314773 RepID=A0A3N2PLJ3_SODAK|nr:hypothetical protein SODALDRAFT_328738 [Sodiomyces alkalinus F11]ROT35397.1 hypothetical protein SODALDRAFT_328738 [Sodiomyces alkalinus F11]
MVVRYNIALWGSLICLAGIILMLNQDSLEKQFPTPHEWSFITRMRVRGAKSANNHGGPKGKNWDEIIVSCREALKRLEDPNIDGAGVRELLNDEPLSIEGLGNVGKDISDKSENWRRGYYEVMMLLARSLEQVDGWVKDKTRNIVCPPQMVVGPSNPRPEPMPPGAPSAPKEENCEPAYESAENAYLRILTTKGFSTKQRLDAALAYAFFLDYKRLPEAAERVYDWALSIATESADPSSPPLVDRRTLTIHDKATPPSDNVLSVLTAIATQKARSGDLSAALPMFISLLRARRSLPSTAAEGSVEETAAAAAAASAAEARSSWWQKLWELAKPPQYPPPPPDGTQAPWRSAKNLCEEAALHLYIGEILYSSQDKAQMREEGVAWTRDGVDLAEEQLRKLGTTGAGDAKETCKECLTTGLENWSTMVKRLARQEAEQHKKREESGGGGSSFGAFWSQPKPQEVEARWAAEEKVVQERVRRTSELLIDAAPPESFVQSLLKA